MTINLNHVITEFIHKLRIHYTLTTIMLHGIRLLNNMFIVALIGAFSEALFYRQFERVYILQLESVVFTTRNI